MAVHDVPQNVAGDRGDGPAELAITRPGCRGHGPTEYAQVIPWRSSAYLLWGALHVMHLPGSVETERCGPCEGAVQEIEFDREVTEGRFRSWNRGKSPPTGEEK